MVIYIYIYIIHNSQLFTVYYSMCSSFLNRFPQLWELHTSAGVPIPPSSGAGGKQWVAGAVELTILLDET